MIASGSKDSNKVLSWQTWCVAPVFKIQIWEGIEEKVPVKLETTGWSLLTWGVEVNWLLSIVISYWHWLEDKLETLVIGFEKSSIWSDMVLVWLAIGLAELPDEELGENLLMLPGG